MAQPSSVLEEGALAGTVSDALEIEDRLAECMKDRGFEYERIVEGDKHHPDLLTLVGTELWNDELRGQYALGVSTLAIPRELLAGSAIGSPLRVGHSFDARMLPGETERSMSYWEEYDRALNGRPAGPGASASDGIPGCFAVISSLVAVDVPPLDDDLSEVGPPTSSSEEQEALIERCMQEAGLPWTGFPQYRSSVLSRTDGFSYGREGDAFVLNPSDERLLGELQEQEFLISAELQRCAVDG